MYCYKCGKKIEEDAKNCKYCGSKTTLELEERMEEIEKKQKMQKSLLLWSIIKK